MSGFRCRALWQCVAALFFTLQLTACAPTPLELLQRGQLREAYAQTRLLDFTTQAQVAHAVLEDEQPAVELHTIAGEELARLVGSYSARQLEPSWLLVRATATTRSRQFPHVHFNVTIGRDPQAGEKGKEVPTYPMQTAAIAALTGESTPKGYRSSVHGGGVCSASALLCFLFWPIAPLTETKVGEVFVAPTREEIRQHAPRAARLSEVLENSCLMPGRCVRHFLVRRPRDEAVPLALRVWVVLSSHDSQSNELSQFSWQVGAVATLDLPPGATLAQRLALTVSPTKMKSGVELAQHRFRGERLRDEPLTALNVDKLPPGYAEPDRGEFCLPAKPEDVAAGEGPQLIPLVPLSTPPLPPPVMTPAPELPAAAAAKFADAWPAAVNAVEAAEESLQIYEINVNQDELGLDRPSLDRARKAVAELAAIIGANEPHVRDFTARLGRAELNAQRYRAEAVAKYKLRAASCKDMSFAKSLVKTEPGRCVEAAPPGTRVCTYPMTFISYAAIDQRFPDDPLRVLLSDGRIVNAELDPPYFIVTSQESMRRVPMRVTIAPPRAPLSTPVVPQTLLMQRVPPRLCALVTE